MSTAPLDILAIAAHRDDAEQTCGGTLLKMAQCGRRTGILDLTQGEMGTRGTAEDRAREATEAARILRVSWRGALDIPDGRIENTWENRLRVARVIREQRPQVLILPYWKGRHPDHYNASILGYEACFLAGLSKLVVPKQGPDEPLSPHRPFKIIYASLYVPSVKPTFVVDITSQFEKKLDAILSYSSQFSARRDLRNLFPSRADLRDRVGSLARYFGLMIGVRYGEPFVTREVAAVEDIVSMPVKSI